MASNSFVQIPAFVGAADGVSVDASGLAAKRTLILSGSWRGPVVLEGSVNDVNFVPIASFTRPGVTLIQAGVPYMRMRASALLNGMPVAYVGALTATNTVLELPLPAAVGGVIDGAGASQDASAINTPLTLISAGGVLSGGITIEASHDDANWAPLFSFGTPDFHVVDAVAAFLRVRASNLRVAGALAVHVTADEAPVLVQGDPMSFDAFTCRAYFQV